MQVSTTRLSLSGSTTTVLYDAKGDPMSISTTSFELTVESKSIEIVDTAAQAGVWEPTRLPIGFALPVIGVTGGSMMVRRAPQRFLDAEARS